MKTHNFATDRAPDLFRGRTGTTNAGVGTILGSAITGTPTTAGDTLVYDPVTDAWVIVNSSTFGTPLTVEDEGTPLTTDADTLNFVGSAVTATGAGGTKTITVAAGLNIEGGQDVIKAHGSMGATETFDPTDGNVHTGTLDANCTFTLSAPAGSGACTLELQLTQDGTGGRVITWPGSVTVSGTFTTTAGTLTKVILETLDGGASWFAFVVGGGGSVTSVALTVPAEFSIAGSPITSSGTLAVTKATQTANTVWAGPTSGAAAQPTFRALTAADIPSGVGTTDHEHINNLWFSGDAVTTAFELPAAPFDSQSVRVWVSGTLTDVTLSGTLLTTMTFGSAPASATNNIVVDLIAAAA